MAIATTVLFAKKKGDIIIYTVLNEEGNIYSMSFSKEEKDIVSLSKKGFDWYYKCLSAYVTTVVENFNK